MILDNVIHAREMQNFSISVYEPFAEFLLADKEESHFELTLLDVVRFAGHACPSMIGAFLISQRAVKELFPQTNVCVRGQVEIEIPSVVTQGATGPISNVFSMIFGSWSESGFGGLRGQFVRRGLLKYEAPEVPAGTYRFRNIESGTTVDILYDPSKFPLPPNAEKLSFQQIWRLKITAILRNPEDYISVNKVSDAE